LKGLTKLSSLQIFGAQVSDTGINDLKQALPGLAILR
jgi:hypothetical protein